MHDSNEGSRRPPSGTALAGIGLELAVTLVLFIYAGYKVDGWLDKSPVFMVVGALLGIVLGFYNLFRKLLPVKS